MKVIDMLDRIAKGEEVPKKIIYNNIIWEYIEHERDYRSKHNAELFFNDETDNTWIMKHLNTKVEIIEEDKKIEKMYGEPRHNYTENELYIVGKINEIIDKINSMEVK